MNTKKERLALLQAAATIAAGLLANAEYGEMRWPVEDTMTHCLDVARKTYAAICEGK